MEQARATAGDYGTITLLVSHRFSTVRMADLIVVLADGRVAEAGTHAELLAAGGRYAEHYRTQARGYTDAGVSGGRVGGYGGPHVGEPGGDGG